MKKTFVRLSAIAAFGLIMASCNNEEANNKLIEADNTAVQALVDSKTAALDAEVAAECDAKVAAAAQAVVDSLANAKPVKGAAKPKAKPAANQLLLRLQLLHLLLKNPKGSKDQLIKAHLLEEVVSKVLATKQ
jgi:hypothetical protein